MKFNINYVTLQSNTLRNIPLSFLFQKKFKGPHIDVKGGIRGTTPAIKIKQDPRVISYRNKNIWLPNFNAATVGFVNEY